MCIPTLASKTSIYNFLTHADSVFIADLHLCIEYPQLLEAFHEFLDHIEKTKPEQLFILGDWFNAWVGDDYVSDTEATWLQALVTKLKLLDSQGTKILFCHGNRDFMLGKKFLQHFNGKLLPKVSYITHQNIIYRLEHGDILCTDDKSYQRFRHIIRNPLVLLFLNAQSLEKRKALANTLRQKSKTNNQSKTLDIMDVNEKAVLKATKNADFLIHGHTHRPDIHPIVGHKKRFVLGDWRVEKNNEVHAVIGKLAHNGFEMVNCVFSTTE